jgi:glutathione S-transferase
LRYADARASAERKLYPDPQAHRTEVLELEAEYDRKLGPSTRRWIYFHTLPDRPRILRVLGEGVPAVQRHLMGLGFPVARAMMRRAMRIDEPNTVRSIDYVRRAFDTVSARLEEGRRFLVGDRFSAADLTFAALAAPVIVPPEYGARLPPLAELPASMQPLVAELRATPAGAFVLRMFREERH